LAEIDCESPDAPTAQLAGGGTLDPADWQSLSRQAHRMLDDMLDSLEHVRERPVWRPMSEKERARFREPMPHAPASLPSVNEEFMEDVLPFTASNVHPGFMGWAQGGGTAVGMLAAMLAAGLNANVGGRDHAPVEVERQIVSWVRKIFGFPKTASGLFVTGTSMANLVATVIARDNALGFEVREKGIAQGKQQLTAYASTATHGCIAKAMDIAGIGSAFLRLIATDDRGRINLCALEEAIERDLQAGHLPFMVIGTAGTTDTGAIDDLGELAALCRRKQIWFHVDGAYGALAMLSPELAPRLKGIDSADSLAFDFHKWGHVPYDAGFILVRDGALQQKAFAASGAYLQREQRGLAAGDVWPCDLGPDLSRSFNALKVWFTFKVYGANALGASIAHTCELARYLGERVEAEAELELISPVQLNIVCFRYRSGRDGDLEKDWNQINKNIVIEIQESGSVAPSMTMLDGKLCIRAAILNHRTGQCDVDTLIDQALALGRSLRDDDGFSGRLEHRNSTEETACSSPKS
jgi:aromatic-L-amino-acid decarboxylase